MFTIDVKNNASDSFNHTTNTPPGDIVRSPFFGDNARMELIESLGCIPKEWALTPVKDKRPSRSGWQTEEPLSQDYLRLELEKERWNGYGLRLGDVSGGKLALDVDGPSAVVILKALESTHEPLLKTVSWASGKDGRSQLLFQIPEHYRDRFNSFKRKSINEYSVNGQILKCQTDENGKPIEELDFRYNGHQSVLPPSFHPETGSYHWINSPNDCEVAIAPDWLCESILELSEPKKVQKNTPLNFEYSTFEKGDKNIHDEWIDAISIDSLNYYAWRDLVFALHYEGYSENEALSISQSSSKHTDKGFYEVWNHIKNDKPNNITGGSLYHLATTYGNWKPKESGKKLPTNNVVHLTPKPQQKPLRKALSELFHEGLSGSILLAAQNDIADSYQKPLSNVQKLYQEIEKESEIKDSRYDNQLEIQALMTAKTQRISLNGLLPEPLANGLNNRAELMNLRPECFLTSLLVGLSSVCNPTTQVTLNKNTDFAVNAGLYGGMVADSSQKKSPVQKTTILKPLFKIQAEYQEKYENKLKDYESDIERYEKLKKDKKSTQALYEEFPDGPPIKPTCENAITTDATGEALKSAIANQSIGTLFFSDELAGLFKSANQYRGGKGSDIEDMLSLYDGQGFNILRKTGSCFISNALLSIFGGIQPEILKGMLGNGKDSNGQWARFIWVEQPLIAGSMPRDGAGIDIDPMIEALYRQFLVHAKTQNFNHTYTLSREAFLIFADAYDEFESSRVAAGDSPMGSVYGKSEGRIGKLALILHLVKYLFTGDTVPNVIEADTVSNAIALTRFYIAQVQGLYGQLVPNGQSLAPQLFKIHKLALSKKEITARQVKQFTKITDTSEGIIQYFRELEAMGFGTIVSSGKTIKYRASAESAESVEDSSTHKEPIHSKDSRVSAESVEEISKFSKNLNPENSDFLNKESSTFSTLEAQNLVETEFGCAENFLHLSALDETQNSQPTTEQGFNQSADSFYTSSTVLQWDDLMQQIDAQLDYLGWTKEEAKNYLSQKYGKTSRHNLSDEQVLEFIDHLESLCQAKRSNTIHAIA